MEAPPDKEKQQQHLLLKISNILFKNPFHYYKKIQIPFMVENVKVFVPSILQMSFYWLDMVVTIL